MNSPVAVWFMISFGAALVAPVLMALWLSSKGAKVSVAHAISSAYVQRVYRAWCAEQQSSPGWVRWVIPVTLANWFVSLVALFLQARR